MRNNHSDVKVVHLADPATITATTTYSNYIDLNGYDQCTLVISYKAGTADGSNYFTPAILEVDSAPGTASGYAVATDYVGTISAVNSTTGATQQWDYVGNKRYVCVRLAETGTASSIFAIVALLSGAKKGPARDNSVTTGTVS